MAKGTTALRLAGFWIGLRSAVFHALSLAVCGVFLPVLLVFPWMSPGAIWAVGRAFVAVQSWLLRWVCNVRVVVEHLGGVPDGPVLFAARHESYWESFALPYLLGNPAVFAKEELVKNPITGTVVRGFNYIPVDRSGSVDGARAAVEAAKAQARGGRSVLIYPSGTRDPARREQVQTGVALLYRGMKIPCVPIMLNSGAVFPYRSWRRNPGTITVRILPAIAPGLPTADFIARLQSDLTPANPAQD